MKKLMVAVVSAASAMFALGDLPHGADFENNNYVVGENFTNYLNKADDGASTVGSRYWASDSEEIGNIAEHSGSVAATVPDIYADAVNNNKYLQLETGSGRLYRNIADDGAAVSMSTGEGIYLDTLVKFSPADSVFGDDTLSTGDKIAIEYVESDDGITNFIVRAGVVGSDVTNYAATVSNFDVSEWHRITVRTVADIGSGRSGFKIYLDGAALVYDTDKDEFAKSAGFTDETRTIFPSAVLAGQPNADSVSAVAFSGSGGIDDVVFTTDMPNFIKTTEAVVATFTADAGVTAITVTVDQAEPIYVDMTAETLTATLPAGTTAFTVNVTKDSTYESVMIDGVIGATANITDYNGSTIAITTTRNNFSLFDANGDAISGTFQTLADAMAAQDVAKIQLAYDYTETTIPSEGPVYTIADGTTLVLDLNGKTLDGGTSDEDELFYVKGALTVIDSGNGGKIVYGGEFGIFAVEGDLAIGSEDDNGPFIDGILFADGSGDLIRAYVKVDGNTTNNELKWTVAPGSSCSATPADGYWVVAPGEAPATFALTTTGGANATVETVPVDVSALTEATSVTITATANADYTYFGVDLSGTDWTYSSANDAITLTLTVSETTAVAVPNAVAKTAWAKLLGNAVNGAYEIDDLVELKAFQANVGTLTTAGETFKLTANITLDAAWPGIGIQNGKDIYDTAAFNAGAFCGTFDGQNYTISGFQMIGKGDNAEGLDYCGFFNSTYGATIQNLKIQYASSLFAADTTASTKESGATFVGVAKNSTLRNLTTVAGTVSCSKGFGGIVGFLTSGTTVDSCTNNVNMTSLANNKCGGIAMITQGGSAVTIQNCQNNGTQTTGSSNSEYGAIVGYVGLDTTIANCETTVGRFLKHQTGTITLQGVNKGDARVLAYHGAATPGLNFATVDGNVATFVADNALALNGNYKVVGPSATATFAFAEAGTIAFDTNLTQNVTFDVTAAEGLDLTDATADGVVTYTATSSAPVTPTIDPADPEPVEITAADADAAIAAVAVSAPAGAGIETAEEIAAYKDLFTYSATEKGTGVYDVALTGIKEEKVAEVNEDAVENLVAAAQDDKETTVSVDVPAGLYYKITTYNTLGGTAVDFETGLSNGTGTTPVDKPASTTQGFIKVELSTVPFN